MAPEALTHNKITKQSDIWSYGILLWECYSYGCTPYPSVPPEQTLKLITNGYRLEKPDDCPQEIYELMLACWNISSEKRPKFFEVVQILETKFNLEGADSNNGNQINEKITNNSVSQDSTTIDSVIESDNKPTVFYSKSRLNSSTCTSSTSCGCEDSDYLNQKHLMPTYDEYELDNRNSVFELNEEFKPFLNKYYNKSVKEIEN